MKLLKITFVKLLLIIPILFGLSACFFGPPTPVPLPFPVEIDPLLITVSREWYVAPSGSDDNDCQTESTSCQTIRWTLGQIEEVERELADTYGALYSSRHTVNLASGRYTEPLATGRTVTLRRNITLQGAGLTETIIDAGGTNTGVYVTGNVSVTINDLNIQNAGGSSGNGVFVNSTVRSFAMSSVRVRDNEVDGILIQTNYEDPELPIVTLTDVLAIRNGDDGLEAGGDVTVRGGQYSHNGQYGITAYSRLNAANTTLANNGIGGLYFSGSRATLNNLSARLNGTESLFSGVRPGILIGSGRVTLSSSRIIGNMHGVYIDGPGSNTTIQNTIFNGNELTAVIGVDGATTLDDVSIRGNGDLSAGTSLPAGIEASGGTFRLENSQVSGNLNGGILVSPSGQLTILNSTIDGNSGHLPGIFNNQGDLTIDSSTISNTISQDGIDNRGDLTMLNSTLSGNGENGIIVGIAPSKTVAIRYSTIANNGQLGILDSESNDGSFTVENTILAGHGRADCYIPGRGSNMVLLGTNLDADDSCRFGDSSLSDLGLSPLADNGGSTLTHALADTSPAIDAATGACISADQRGASRPFSTSCDVGAYEFNPTFGAVPASLEDEDLVLITVTPPAQTGFIPPVVILDSLCWTGPGNLYEVISSVKQGVEVELLGTGAQSGWLVVDNPLYNVPCWLPQDNLEIDPAIDLTTLKVFPVPPLPTATSAPSKPQAPGSFQAVTTTCNQQEYINTLTWKDKANNEIGYRVYRGGQLIATLGPNATQYKDSPGGNGPYEYYVEAFNNAGSAKSNSDKDDGC